MRSTLASRMSSRPPLILIHGAANSSSVFVHWQQELTRRGWDSFAVDLRGHGRSTADLSEVTMGDYVQDVVSVVDPLRRPPVLLGWSMGGLVAMMASAVMPAMACVGLAPSTPSTSIDKSVELRHGVFNSAEYGITNRDPNEQMTMPDLAKPERQIALDSLCVESLLARDERKRGVVIESLPCPLLVVTGSLDQYWPSSKYTDLAIAHELVEFDGLSHWGLVLNRERLPNVVAHVTSWLETTAV